MLSNAAFNALLKTLEEPPPHAIFVLATTEPHKIPATVLSRCQRFDFRRISVSEIVVRLEWLTQQEDIQADREALTLIARQATGSMRDAESLLDQLASYDGKGITVADVRAALGAGASEMVLQVTDALAKDDVAQGLGAINTAVDEGADPRQFARQMVEHLRALLLVRLESGVIPPHVSDDMRPRLKEQAHSFSPRALARAVRLFNQAAAEAKGGWQPQLPLEMAFVEAALPPEPESAGPRTPPTQDTTRSSSPAHRAASSPAKTRSTPVRSAPPAPPQPSKTIQEPGPAYSNPPSGDGSLSPEGVRTRWPEFLNALRPRNLSLEALMRSCEPVAVEGDVVLLGFTHNFHRSKVEEQHNKQLVEDVLSSLVGQRCSVRCVLAGQERAAPPPQRAQAESPEREPGRSAEQIIAEDPVVRAAIEDLGAQIVQGHE